MRAHCESPTSALFAIIYWRLFPVDSGLAAHLQASLYTYYGFLYEQMFVTCCKYGSDRKPFCGSKNAFAPGLAIAVLLKANAPPVARWRLPDLGRAA